MVLDLLLIGLAITLGPVHNTAFILLLSAEKGVRKGVAFILAWLASLVVVIACVLLITGGKPPAHQSASSTAALAVKLALGLGMVIYGERKRRRGKRPRKPPKWLARLDSVSGWTAAGMGVLLQPWGVVGAGAATVVQADLSEAATYLSLVGYCLLATASLLVMELYTTFKPVAAQARLGALHDWIAGHQDQAIVSLSLGLGLWLMAKSILQLVN
ncbi:GAP family protein [Kitasatospora azatica]|uniref:GAP family protein n=1 Tax=Kitasatospora azatica TaxID=58347 RepID=UPI0005639786|nr:GAP family protein [Kitasatospora azatica]